MIDEVGEPFFEENEIETSKSELEKFKQVIQTVSFRCQPRLAWSNKHEKIKEVRLASSKDYMRKREEPEGQGYLTKLDASVEKNSYMKPLVFGDFLISSISNYREKMPLVIPRVREESGKFLPDFNPPDMSSKKSDILRAANKKIRELDKLDESGNKKGSSPIRIAPGLSRNEEPMSGPLSEAGRYAELSKSEYGGAGSKKQKIEQEKYVGFQQASSPQSHGASLQRQGRSAAISSAEIGTSPQYKGSPAALRTPPGSPDRSKDRQ